ncbi:MAG TPA: HAMP domain-containing sensor histidine kinase [Polyangia bacterium]|jgi:signal transduction histidine kinase|nr:HAMP domain-containing sensor histidine kinase [Polyangia bacterium]
MGADRLAELELEARREAALQTVTAELSAARAAAEQSRAEAEALLRFNEVVAGILAHDLKNPLAAILMNARLLRDADAERARTVGARIVTSGERMSRMIDQILEWTRLRAGAGWVHLTRAACDLGALTDEAVVELRGRKADAAVVVEASGDLRGSWDADRLAQVISNLVGNGLDHASSPGVRVTLDGSGAQVRLAVKNTGTIDDDFLPLVFEPFRGRTAGVKSRGRGLGLGLYITRQIVLAHGGTVEVERGPEGTVTFVVTLPREP